MATLIIMVGDNWERSSGKKYLEELLLSEPNINKKKMHVKTENVNNM